MDISIVGTEQAAASQILQEVALLKQRLKIGEIVEGEIKEVINNKTSVVHLKGFDLKAVTGFNLQKNQKIQAEVKALNPKIRLHLIDSRPQLYSLPSTTQARDAKDYYITTLYQLLPGIEKGEFKVHYDISTPQARQKREAKIEILLQMSELGCVVIRINQNSLGVEAERQEVKQLIEAHKGQLGKNLKRAGLAVRIGVDCRPGISEEFHDKEWINLKA